VKTLKFLLALLFLPALWASLGYAADLVRAVHGRSMDWWPWICWASGLGLGFLVYGFLPRPTWLYVLGHESTHALAVWMSGGRVRSFRATSRGGAVSTDRNSTWISLSPYIFPFHPLLIAGVWLLAQWSFPGIAAGWPWFLVLWGAVWAMHWGFTATLMATRQPDFAVQGFFYSYVVILTANLWLLIAAFWALARPFSLGRGCGLLAGRMADAYSACIRCLFDLVRLFI
jgi:hypothetical protein